MEFDKKRNLEAHKKSLLERQEAGNPPAGNCALCAEAWCLLNTTSKKILDQLGEGDIDAVDQFSCDDFADDESIPRDLRD